MSFDVRDMKRRTVLELYGAEPVFQLVVDVQVPGVLLPPNWMKAQPPTCVLNVGEGLARPVPDLVIDAEGLSGTFSFAQTPFFVRVPWDSLGAVVVPGTVGIGWQPLGEPVVQAPPKPVEGAARSRFKVIEGGGG